MHLGQTTEFKDRIAAVSKAANVAGLAAGTTVMTLDGELPVEHLNAGDRVITRDAGMSVLREIRSHEVYVASIQIKAGSLGHTRPQDDLLVGPDTLVHIRDWRAKALFGADVATVKAKRLIDGEFISEQDATKMTVYELIFDRQHILYADGLEVASAAV
ncbi:Hint domain-containing protein [Octadecabacter sp. CECT 8868]|uniref:Hint domain-containing protein n=1 Tax=Octadecabacter algicola TaxID=2909342 RepID=UPI001F32E8E7|nr:Hint domain-containing protein [Octadecabacter algicola]MCF2903517.1 Hint domain-containing protein [Octadecabacter algicola]